ncbi:MAG: peptidoglycan DD-metalloendopeptidase family protein [Betaproteobacteria bacterium]|nr:peptidoglycan DD-metalloendopeptidase family protein [Betaproteobacteria bacterium]
MAFPGTLGRSIAVALFALFGVVAAFATIAPGREAAEPLPSTSLVVEPLSLQAREVPLVGAYVQEEQFKRGDTLASFLERLGLDDSAIALLARSPALRVLRPGSQVRADFSGDGSPTAISFLTGRDTLVKIQPQGDGFRATEEQASLETRVTMKANVIKSSLFAATDDVGIPDSIAMQLADVFGGDIDFHRDLRAGDHFTVVYELYQLNGRAVRAGRLLAAEFVNKGRPLRAVRYGSSYYGPDGKNLRKAFLRSPLEFSRISSGFGMRKHPIQKTWRTHQGTDYAAPTGTRVRATGDAVVEFAGVKGGYGNVVILRHNGQYSTVYAHLSRIGVRRGARVTQSDIIGYVGQTGWATGPHLHYEFRVAGQARNPLTIALPAALPLPASEVASFKNEAAPLISRLDLVAQGSLAQLE